MRSLRLAKLDSYLQARVHRPARAGVLREAELEMNEVAQLLFMIAIGAIITATLAFQYGYNPDQDEREILPVSVPGPLS